MPAGTTQTKKAQPSAQNLSAKDVTIREIRIEDFEPFYSIWEAGNARVFGNNSIDVKAKKRFYRAEFRNRIQLQDDTFKIWGCFYGKELLGWMSVLPCRPGPFVCRHYGELSTYIKPAYYNTKVGMFLGSHLLNYARSKSELWHIETYIGEKNKAAMKLAMNFGFVPVGAMPQGDKDKMLGKIFIWALAL